MSVDLQYSDQIGGFAATIVNQKYAHTKKDGSKETWDEIANRVANAVMGVVDVGPEMTAKVREFIRERKFIPGGRYLYSSGRQFHQTNNCILLRAEDSREGWADLINKATLALMTGAGIGVDYSDVRGEGKIIRRTGGTSTGPIALMQMVNEAGRHIMQGGSRRSAIWAGLKWSHPDIHKFISIKNWAPEVRALKEKDFNFPATLDGTNVSVILDDEFFEAYSNEEHARHSLAHGVYWAVVKQMLSTAEPGFSIDVGINAGETLRNACTEVTSRDDSDVCNLGSINLSRIRDVEEMRVAVEIGTIFLLAGSVYSDVSYPKIDQMRTKNRRLGLGLMGIHEWLLKNGKRYGPDDDLEKLLEIYATSTEIAERYAREWGISAPVKTRAIAPNGTIGIAAETTTSAEPIFCVAFKRRYLKHKIWNYQYVVDPTADRLIKSGVHPDHIEDAYRLAEDVERRVAFQAWLQRYVDHGISSTINLPAWGSEFNNESLVSSFGNMLIKYLPRLRGITCYPDGARGGQPLVPVQYATAIKHLGKIFEEGTASAIREEHTIEQNIKNAENELTDEQASMPLDVCEITKPGSCG